MPSHEWFEKTALLATVLWVPAGGLVAFFHRAYKKKKERESGFPLSYWTAIIVCFLYAASIINILVQWSVSYMVGWPLLAFALNGLGICLIRSTPRNDRWILAGSNLLLLVLSFASIVPPN